MSVAARRRQAQQQRDDTQIKSRLQLRSQSFVSRDDGRSARQNTALVIAVIFVGIVGAGLIFYLILRCIRRRKQEPPKFFPDTLKKRWRNWQPGQMTSSGHAPLNTVQLPTAAQRASTRRNRATAANSGAAAAAVGVDRNSSIRSIMTLPEYRPLPAPDRERTIGLPGERAGIDVVIEFPETEEEEEGRREEHMETMFQIRRARARERELAREAADEARRAEATNSTASLMAALQSVTEREARLSQVAYAEIGIQRPDGSRVRPSMDSDRPLLSSAAGMGGGGRGCGRGHSRSQSSLSNAESMGTPERRRSDEIFNMGSARPSMDQRNSTNSSLHPSSATTIRHVPDDIPAPDYDGADWGPPPEYTSPIETTNTGPNTLPILVIDTGTPNISRSTTPQPPVAHSMAPPPPPHPTSA